MFRAKRPARTTPRRGNKLVGALLVCAAVYSATNLFQIGPMHPSSATTTWVAESLGEFARSSPPHRGGGGRMHVVFSTSCSVEHDWQSYLFFFHALLHEQPGTVTRIVSGCTPTQQQALERLHREQIAVMSDRFHLHFTPEFGRVRGFSFQVTKYWNKPFGVKDWLEHKFGFRSEHGEPVPTPHDDDVIVLVDPDMLMQRPFVNNFTDVPKHFWHDDELQSYSELYDRVSQGHPIAQTYSFGDAWLDAAKQGNLTEVVGADSPVLTVSEHDARVTFSAGPPYLLTARDLYRVSCHWVVFTPRIQKHFPGMMAEMYGYCAAAAHLNLRHRIARGMMVSNVEMAHGEGWGFLEGGAATTTTREVCDVAQFRDTVPHVIHFCQRYAIGDFFLSKYKVPTEILSCDHALFELPPIDIASRTDYSHYGDDSITRWTGNKATTMIRRNAFMVCAIMPALNMAATFFKDHHCPRGANYHQTWNHFREIEAQHCPRNAASGCPV